MLLLKIVFLISSILMAEECPTEGKVDFGGIQYRLKNCKVVSPVEVIGAQLGKLKCNVVKQVIRCDRSGLYGGQFIWMGNYDALKEKPGLCRLFPRTKYDGFKDFMGMQNCMQIALHSGQTLEKEQKDLRSLDSKNSNKENNATVWEEELPGATP